MIFKKLGLYISILIVSVFMIVACQHEPFNPSIEKPSYSENCDPDTVYFQNQIFPLIVSGCATTECHDAITHEHNVDLTSYASIIEEVKVMDANDSELYKVLLETDPEDRMPPAPNNPFSNEQKELIKKWINQGALNNACDDCDTVFVNYEQSVKPILENTCIGCHSGQGAGAGIQLDLQSQLDESVNNGSLLGSIRHESGYSPMPKDGYKLSDCKIRMIEIWIDENYK